MPARRRESLGVVFGATVRILQDEARIAHFLHQLDYQEEAGPSDDQGN